MARIPVISEDSWEFVNKEQFAENNEKNDDSDVEDEDDDWVRMYDDDYDDLIRKFGNSSKLIANSMDAISSKFSP
ncbi:unnamed protein product [Onchocerca flexuosa]|uniref:Eukaryotic translation initiation factor 3 30 kDa subunit n=1 Tax=Onchocerca flexuosa TaxID=387005 RepID=A0A183HIP9_9BILA|nr:unnamed protein product [Onchocerca flexuosa]